MGNQNQIKVAVYLPTDLVTRVDAHVEVIRKRSPGLQVTRSDAVRALLDRGLNEVTRTRT